MAFFETEFPTAIAFDAVGGPAFNTTVNTGFSGYEQRNQNWAAALGKWKIELAYKPQSYFDSVYAFWLNVGGRADAFRFKDHKDFSAAAQACAEVSAGVYQLQKTYTVGARNYVRTIKKPVTSAVKKFDGSSCADTVTVYDGGVAATGWTLDETKGLITGLAAGHTITADFEFHFPVRFDVDDLQAQIEPSDVPGGSALITWPNVQLVEVRL